MACMLDVLLIEYHQLLDKIPEDIKQAFFKEMEKLPVGHIAKPDEVAEAYTFLMKYVLQRRAT